jgi:hypothetical protein
MPRPLISVTTTLKRLIAPVLLAPLECPAPHLHLFARQLIARHLDFAFGRHRIFRLGFAADLLQTFDGLFGARLVQEFLGSDQNTMTR